MGVELIIDTRISVNKEGILTKIKRKTRAVSYITCPNTFININSDYLRCAEYKDIASGIERVLVFQVPCT